MEDHVPRHAQMGAWVLINDRWYYNPTPLSKPSSQFITQFIAQQVLPHDEREGVGFAGDGARAYATARARAEDTLGPVIPVEIRA